MALTPLHALRNVVASKSSTRAPEAELRVLIVQHKGDSAEAKVVSTLISSVQRELPPNGQHAILVVQFGRERLAQGERLREIPGVEVASIDIGGSLGVRQPRMRMIGYLTRLALSIPALVTRVWAFCPDVIYTSQQRWDVRLAMFLSLLLRRPHVVHLHYMPGPWLGRDVMWRLRTCAKVICVSDFIRRKALAAGVPADRSTVIRNVLAPDAVKSDMSRDEAREALCHELQISPSDVLVGMVARVAPGKGQRELVRAMTPLLTRGDAKCQLILVGSETYPELGYAWEVLDIVNNEGTTARVHWLGERSDVPNLLRAFDVFAHPSFDEPCGLSVIEALLAGLPCVVWRDGGPAELVVDGETGRLVETGNVEALTSALTMLCHDATVRDRMHQVTLANTARVAYTLSTAHEFCRALRQAANPT